MLLLRNIHHFVSRLFWFVGKGNWLTPLHNWDLDKGQYEATKFVPATAKVAKPKYMGAKPKQKPLIANDINCMEGIQTAAMKMSKQESLHDEKKTLDTQQKDEWQQRPPHNAQELWLYEQIRWWVELRCEWQIYMKWGKASSWTLKEDYSWRGANAACETDAKLLFCPECFLHMQALEQVPPQPRDLHVPMVLTTAIGHPFSWSRQ